jgi:hypothetical protein
MSLKRIVIGVVIVVAVTVSALLVGFGPPLLLTGHRPILVDGMVLSDGTQVALTMVADDAYGVGLDVKRRGGSWCRYWLDNDDFFWLGSLSEEPREHMVVVRKYGVEVARLDLNGERLVFTRTGKQVAPRLGLAHPFARDR